MPFRTAPILDLDAGTRKQLLDCSQGKLYLTLAAAAVSTVSWPHAKKSGFSNVVVEPKDESKTFIKEWVPGSNVEDYIVSVCHQSCKTKFAELLRRTCPCCERSMLRGRCSRKAIGQRKLRLYGAR